MSSTQRTGTTLAQRRSTEDRREHLSGEFVRIRGFSDRITEPLSAEDCVIQSMADVSPTRWHLAHTTWFFETFVLSEQPGYRPFDERFAYLFNSYYNAVGEQFPRASRGLLSRPSVAEVRDYRRQVDEAMRALFDSESAISDRLLDVIELGLNHEQQHQELMLTDIKHVFSCNPLWPKYTADRPLTGVDRAARTWETFDEGLYEIGHAGGEFAFDNESPRHRVFLEAFAIRSHPVTEGEFQEFIADDGYQRPELWLSLGWQFVQEQGWLHPLYWHTHEGNAMQFTLAGLLPRDPALPVCHLSYFEADAFARWAGARLPTEAEWEAASAGLSIEGNFADSLLDAEAAIHPTSRPLGNARLAHWFGDVWEWTSSPYTAYPGYRPPSGALGEYNGKFMCNQFVLRGGSCATPAGHMWRTYRNFFPPESRWQFAGLRLARDRR